MASISCSEKAADENLRSENQLIILMPKFKIPITFNFIVTKL